MNARRTGFVAPLFALANVVCMAPHAGANVPEGAWPDGPIQLTFRLDSFAPPALPPGGLADGSAGWNAAVLPALAMWNSTLARAQFTGVAATTGTPSEGDGKNDLYFGSTFRGLPFGSRTLAVTLISRAGTRGLRFTETDVVFNTAFTWNSYRGPLRVNDEADIRRVALHELGHVLGLNHPDQATPSQNVVAIMNSVISNIETLQADDVTGAQILYGSSVPAQTFTRQPAGINANEGDFVSLSFDLNGATPPPKSLLHQYSWFMTPPGRQKEFLFTVEEPVLLLGSAQPDDSGVYEVEVANPNGEITSTPVTVNIAPVATTADTRLGNISTRGLAGTGARSLIVGFVVGGTQNTRVLVRAVGPSLAAFGVGGTISDPTLSLSSTSNVSIATNDNWGDNGGASALAAAFAQVHAFPLTAGSPDSALVATLAPGAYTAVVTPKDGVEGVALVEAYQLDDGGTTDSRLVNLSTRGPVGTGANIMIAGLVVRGSGPKRYLVRAVGDTLATFGLSGTLDDPFITLFDGAGSRLRTLDDWDVPEFLQPKLQQTMAAVSAFPLSDRQESVLLTTLNPGNYTLHVSGLDGGTGVAIVEAYEIQN